MNRNESEVEVLPSPTAIVLARIGVNKAEFQRVLQEQVAEIMAERDAFVFEPFFRSRQIAYELKRLQTVPEQRKWTIYFERYGCMICETRKLIHIGNGMCRNCYPREFNRLKQIIAEGVSGQTARPAAGTPQAARLLPAVRPADAPHHCWLQRSTKEEKAIYDRVAKKLGVNPQHVRRVALGRRHSEAIEAALKKERAKIIREERGRK